MVGLVKSELQAPPRVIRNVSTTLNYMRPPSCEGLQPIKFERSEAEGRNVQREGIADVRDVVIKDIRGREHDFTLDVQGFQYVKHQIDGVTDWEDNAQVKQIVQPATEALIKRVKMLLQNTFCSRVFTHRSANRAAYESSLYGRQYLETYKAYSKRPSCVV